MLAEELDMLNKLARKREKKKKHNPIE